jgi:hypothetical protein
MDKSNSIHTKSRFPYIYELFIWFIYVCLYKYSHYIEAAPIPPGIREDFPYPQLILYAIGMTVYTIPFYRWLAPLLLRKKKYGWFFLVALLYFGFVAKWMGWLVSVGFYSLSSEPLLVSYYRYQYLNLGRRAFGVTFWDLNILVTDLIAFLSLTFTWYAFENERKKLLLENDNLALQLDSLKAQLHPHFLFNTLNSIYGMSLTGNKETPAFILRLSDMMRYILYYCRSNSVLLEKDIEFLNNYLAMEQQRYPAADIRFTISGPTEGKTIAPLLFIPFLENSFKHGAHRLNDKGFIHGSLEVFDKHLRFHIGNDAFTVVPTLPAGAGQAFLKEQEAIQTYGGVGIDNVKKRLALYYPGKHTLTISQDNNIFVVQLDLFF